MREGTAPARQSFSFWWLIFAASATIQFAVLSVQLVTSVRQSDSSWGCHQLCASVAFWSLINHLVPRPVIAARARIVSLHPLQVATVSIHQRTGAIVRSSLLPLTVSFVSVQLKRCIFPQLAPIEHWKRPRADTLQMVRNDAKDGSLIKTLNRNSLKFAFPLSLSLSPSLTHTHLHSEATIHADTFA